MFLQTDIPNVMLQVPDNSHTTTEIISNTLPAGTANAALKYNVEIRAGHNIDSPTLSNALNIGDPIVSL